MMNLKNVLALLLLSRAASETCFEGFTDECPLGKQKRAEDDEHQCKETGCTDDDCCFVGCQSFTAECPANKNKKSDGVCGDGVCTENDCCGDAECYDTCKDGVCMNADDRCACMKTEFQSGCLTTCMPWDKPTVEEHFKCPKSTKCQSVGCPNMDDPSCEDIEGLFAAGQCMADCPLEDRELIRKHFFKRMTGTEKKCATPKADADELAVNGGDEVKADAADDADDAGGDRLLPQALAMSVAVAALVVASP